jgi:hypothetical protein
MWFYSKDTMKRCLLLNFKSKAGEEHKAMRQLGATAAA